MIKNISGWQYLICIYCLMFTFSHSECSVHSKWGRIRTRAINTGSDLHGIRSDSERASVEGLRGGGGHGGFRTTRRFL